MEILGEADSLIQFSFEYFLLLIQMPLNQLLRIFSPLPALASAQKFTSTWSFQVSLNFFNCSMLHIQKVVDSHHLLNSSGNMTMWYWINRNVFIIILNMLKWKFSNSESATKSEKILFRIHHMSCDDNVQCNQKTAQKLKKGSHFPCWNVWRQRKRSEKCNGKRYENNFLIKWFLTFLFPFVFSVPFFCTHRLR